MFFVQIFEKPKDPFTGIKCNEKCGGEIIENPHSAIGLPPFQCNKCTKGFSRGEYEKLVEESKQPKGPP